MINKFAGLAIVAALLLCMASVALARGAPTKQNAFTNQAVVSVQVAPVVANVPPTAGFDVIQNLSTAAYSRLAIANHIDSDTSARGSRSTTVAERSYTGMASYSARSGPNLANGLRS